MAGGQLTLAAHATRGPVRRTRVRQPTKVVLKVKPSKKVKKNKVKKNVFGNSNFIKMRYVYNGIMNTTVSTSAFSIGQRLDANGLPIDLFNLNKITYPRTGSQTLNLSDFRPHGYNQVDDIYSEYKVYGSAINIKFSNPSQDGLKALVKVSASDDTQRLNGNYVVNAAQWDRVFCIDLNDTGSQTKTWKRYYSIGSIDGVTKSQFKNDIAIYKGVFNAPAGPSSVPKVELGLASDQATGVANPPTMEYQITIDYYVRLFRRKVIPSSTI